MHTRAGVSLGSVIEDSINYQNGEVYALYAMIFLVLAVICTVYYQYSICIARKKRKPVE